VSLMELLEYVKSVGFPMAVAGFLLWRLDDTLRKLVRGFQQMAEQLRETRENDIRDLKGTVEEVGHRVIREVDHNMRGVLSNISLRSRGET
jgi:hypothetical protein